LFGLGSSHFTEIEHPVVVADKFVRCIKPLVRKILPWLDKSLEMEITVHDLKAGRFNTSPRSYLVSRVKMFSQVIAATALATITSAQITLCVLPTCKPSPGWGCYTSLQGGSQAEPKTRRSQMRLTF